MIHSWPIVAHRIVRRRAMSKAARTIRMTPSPFGKGKPLSREPPGEPAHAVPAGQYDRRRRVPPTIGTKCHVGGRRLARIRWHAPPTALAVMASLPAPVAVAGHCARSWRHHHRGVGIPVKDDELEPSGRVGPRIRTGNVPRGDAVSLAEGRQFGGLRFLVPPALPGSPFFVSGDETRLCISASAGSESWKAAIPSL
jgi:hypothetical protein